MMSTVTQVIILGLKHCGFSCSRKTVTWWVLVNDKIVGIRRSGSVKKNNDARYRSWIAKCCRFLFFFQQEQAVASMQFQKPRRWSKFISTLTVHFSASLLCHSCNNIYHFHFGPTFLFALVTMLVHYWSIDAVFLHDLYSPSYSFFLSNSPQSSIFYFTFINLIEHYHYFYRLYHVITKF